MKVGEKVVDKVGEKVGDKKKTDGDEVQGLREEKDKRLPKMGEKN